MTPILDFPVRIDRNSLTLGYAGVYSSFLLFARRAEAKYGVPAREILIELGRLKMVGGQEDMIEDTTINMARGPVVCSPPDRVNKATITFRAARDLLLRHRSDYDVRDARVRVAARCPAFNWALDHFDDLACGNHGNTALWIVDDARR